MREKKKLSADERQQIFDDHNTCNLGHKNNSDNGCQSDTNKTNTNFPINQLGAIIDASKQRLEFFPETAAS